MDVATWNVNGIRARAGRAGAWMDRAAPDVLCLQETKVPDEDFPRQPFADRGYRVEAFGQRGYNGVALIVREGLGVDGVRRGLPDDADGAERRVLAATVGDVRVITVYVPNGRFVGAEAYGGKLQWMDRLRAMIEEEAGRHGSLVVLGDFNVAPDDRDVHDPEAARGRIMFSDAEKEAYRALLDVGLEDVLRRLTDEGGLYTWWDYRRLAFPKNRGWRIDHVLATPPLAGRTRNVRIDRDERKGRGASDHVPVVATFA